MSQTQNTELRVRRDARPVRMVITTRVGGVSAAPYLSFNLADHVGDDPESVAANRQRLSQAIDLDASRIVWMEQLHTNTVTVVDESWDGEPVPATDALVTRSNKLALAVLTADCVPVLIADHTHGVVGAAHAGRLGARNGIVERTVNTMIECGAHPGSMQVLLGPAAAGESYEVPPEMSRDVDKHLPGSLCRTKRGTCGLDLRKGIMRQLLSLGVTAIDADPRNTITCLDFFSHRREGTTGRQASLVWLNKDKDNG